MPYSVNYDPNTGKASVQLSREDYERILNTPRSILDILRDSLTIKKGKKK